MAQLVLQDGTMFEGESFGAPVSTDGPSTLLGTGEVVFNTGMVGYPESCTDPSYRGQILIFTYPLIGNYGVPSEEPNEHGFSRFFESEDVHVRGVVCGQVSEEYSHFQAKESFPAWLARHGVPGITGVDTRALTKKLREHGVMLGRIVRGELPLTPPSPLSQPHPLSSQEGNSTVFGQDRERGARTGGEGMAIDDPNLRNLVAEVSCEKVLVYEPGEQGACLTTPGRVIPSDLALSEAKGKIVARETRPGTRHDTAPTVVVYDCGIKRNILRSLLMRGARVVRVPWDFDLSRADFSYDGIVISNGPGDPKACTATIAQVAWALERNIPTFGICLGIQLMALAIGGNTYKLKYGHRGANQPCVGEGQRCIITSQNHGYAVEEGSLPKGWSVWFRNANDGTVEGIRHENGKFLAVQFHPEATPGPEDAGYLFDEFLSVL